MILKYKGGGFLPNIPSRDLSEEELENYDMDLLLSSGLYEKVGRPKEQPEEEQEEEELDYGREST